MYRRRGEAVFSLVLRGKARGRAFRLRCRRRSAGLLSQLGPAGVEGMAFVLCGGDLGERLLQRCGIRGDLRLLQLLARGSEASVGLFNALLDGGELAGFEIGEFLFSGDSGDSGVGGVSRRWRSWADQVRAADRRSTAPTARSRRTGRCDPGRRVQARWLRRGSADSDRA